MCDFCEGNLAGAVEVTDETAPIMIHETTTIAFRAAAAVANGWHNAATGYVKDMRQEWGLAGMARMAYVWGSAMFFLPSPPDHSSESTYDGMARAMRDDSGTEPEPGDVVRKLAIADQARALADEVKVLASKGELAQVAALLADAEPHVRGSLINGLMSEFAVRLRHTRDTDDSLSIDLFNAHIQADMPQPVDEAGGGTDGD